MKNLLAATSLILSIIFSSLTNASAQGIPVIDNSQIAQVIATLQQQIKDYEQQLNQLTTLKDQFTNMQQRLQAMTGAKGISSILNSAAEKAERNAASNLKSIIDGAISGAVISGNVGDMNSVISDLKSRFDLTDLPEFNSSTIASNKAIASLAGSGLAAVATADDTYKRANAAVGRVNFLVDEIDNTADLKASVDFNTRVNAEVALLLLELIRVQSSQANAAGMQALYTARDGQASRNFMKTGDSN